LLKKSDGFEMFERKESGWAASRINRSAQGRFLHPAPNTFFSKLLDLNICISAYLPLCARAQAGKWVRWVQVAVHQGFGAGERWAQGGYAVRTAVAFQRRSFEIHTHSGLPLARRLRRRL
jgi:hypothetical protein